LGTNWARIPASPLGSLTEGRTARGRDAQLLVAAVKAASSADRFLGVGEMVVLQS
jgi:hypothetical protein